MKTFALIVVLAIIGSVVSRIVYRVGPLTDEEIDRANVIIDYFYKQWKMDWTKIRKPCRLFGIAPDIIGVKMKVSVKMVNPRTVYLTTTEQKLAEALFVH
ncbi:unnamed protein product [Caenorhabditis nigoni]